MQDGDGRSRAREGTPSEQDSSATASYDPARQPRAARFACVGLGCILASYFVLLPVREDAILGYGTERLPALFMVSLVATLCVSPISALLTSVQPLGRGHQAITYAFSAVILGLYALISMTAQPPLAPKSDKPGAGIPLTLAAILFVTVPLINLVTTSTLWALAAGCFSPTHAVKYYGMLSAGATAGQLLGSGTALLCTRFLRQRAGAPIPLLISAGLLMAAARCMGLLVASSAHARTGPSEVVKKAGPGLALWQEPSQALAYVRHGVRVHMSMVWRVARTPFLIRIAAHIALSAMVSSLVYFQRALVVSRAFKESSSRQSFFATLNSISASLILLLQLYATPRLMARLGVCAALCVTPVVSVVGFLLMAWRPMPQVVGGVEVIRKMIMYSLGKPTREVLFTVLSREELATKVVLDTLVCRVGDALAAELYRRLNGDLHVGPRTLALTGCAVCIVWLVVAVALGAGFQQRRTESSGVQPLCQNVRVD